MKVQEAFPFASHVLPIDERHREILPCSCCGSLSDVDVTVSLLGSSFAIGCNAGGYVTDDHQKFLDALLQWNTRQAEASALLRLRTLSDVGRDLREAAKRVVLEDLLRGAERLTAEERERLSSLTSLAIRASALVEGLK